MSISISYISLSNAYLINDSRCYNTVANISRAYDNRANTHPANIKCAANNYINFILTNKVNE